MIEHAPRRAAHDLPARLQLLDLAPHRRAPVDRHHLDVRMGTDASDLRRHLQGQLARRQQHDRLHELVGRIDEAIGHRDAERRGLPRAGAGLDHDVAPLPHERQGRALHLHGLEEAHVGDRAQDLGAQAQVGEGGALGGRFWLRNNNLIGHGLFSPGGEADDLASRSPIFFMRWRIRSMRGASSVPNRLNALV